MARRYRRNLRRSSCASDRRNHCQLWRRGLRGDAPCLPGNGQVQPKMFLMLQYRKDFGFVVSGCPYLGATTIAVVKNKKAGYALRDSISKSETRKLDRWQDLNIAWQFSVPCWSPYCSNWDEEDHARFTNQIPYHHSSIHNRERDF